MGQLVPARCRVVPLVSSGTTEGEPGGISRRYICLAVQRLSPRRGVRATVRARAVYKVISIRIWRSPLSPDYLSLHLGRIELISLISVNDFARGKRPSQYAVRGT